MIIGLKLGMSSMLTTYGQSLDQNLAVMPDAGKSAIIAHTLYGLKSAGAAFHLHLAAFIPQIGYTSCKADPDLWFKAETRPDDNFRHYTYILCYIDDI
jgi:hypothetical protein